VGPARHGRRVHQPADVMHQSLIDCIAWMKRRSSLIIKRRVASPHAGNWLSTLPRLHARTWHLDTALCYPGCLDFRTT
jgi:hypothetical protein